jgi:hypothetical protein
MADLLEEELNQISQTTGNPLYRRWTYLYSYYLSTQTTVAPCLADLKAMIDSNKYYSELTADENIRLYDDALKLGEGSVQEYKLHVKCDGTLYTWKPPVRSIEEESDDEDFGDMVDTDDPTPKPPKSLLTQVQLLDEGDVHTRLVKNSVITQNAKDLTKMSIETVYAYLRENMTETQAALFNMLLKAKQSDRVKALWASTVGHIAMMTGAMSDAEIVRASQLPREQWQNPYEYYGALSDTIVSRILASKTSMIYFDPGEVGNQVVICRMGAVVNHSKHNVAFGVEENHYQLSTFITTYQTNHPEVVKRVRQKMALLAVSPVHGVFMKYRPKMASSIDMEKRVDANRFEVAIRKHGSYPEVEVKLPVVDLQILAMVSMASSPLALFSLMSHAPNSQHILETFVHAAVKQIKMVTFGEVRAFYRFVQTNVERTFDSDVPRFHPDQLSVDFSGVMRAQVYPNVAKDKGIYNNLLRILQPYGSVTLQLGCILYNLDPLFALGDWVCFGSSDVVSQLHLNVKFSDNCSAPSRSGSQNQIATAPAGGLKYRDRKVEPGCIDYGKPSIVFDDKGFKKGHYWFMDLAFSSSLLAISDADRVQRHAAKNIVASMDYFAHDNHQSDYTSASLVSIAKADKKVTANWKGFVVVIPISKLTQVFCKVLMSVYDLTFCLGAPGMTFSVYLVGHASVKPSNVDPSVFGQLCTTAVFMRMQLYQKLYSGYPDAVNEIVNEQHDILRHARYVRDRSSMMDEGIFVAMFAKEKVAVRDTMSVIQTIVPPSDMTKLSSNMAELDESSAGVNWD